MLNNICIYSFILTALILSGCGTNAYEIGNRYSLPVVGSQSPPLKVNEIEKNSLPADLEFGIALSGGGIRSSLYAIGVMKALYDNGYLQKINVISSVSGGGYAAYWLLMGEYTSRKNFCVKSEFGQAMFNDEGFYENTCRLRRYGNFVTNTNYVGSSTGKLAGNELAFSDMYQNQINIIYAKNKDQGITFTDFATKVERGELPYFIVNTTLQDNEAISIDNWYKAVVEMTPLVVGNNEYGYAKWSTDIQYSRGIAISGAAINKILDNPALSQTVTIDHISSDKILLSDGGHSENLGAFALITRGVKNILIVDAEWDKKYQFNSYVNLKNKLADRGITLKIDKIDDYLESGSSFKEAGGPVFTGEVEIAGQPKLNIYYIKMSISSNLMQQAKLADQKKLLSNLEPYALRGKYVDCAMVTKPSISYEKYYSAQVKAYYNYSLEGF